jgi:transmembrane sensor
MSETKDHLILSYLQGNLSPDEAGAFETWRNESDENRRTVEEFQKIWQLSNNKGITIDFQSEQEWQRLESSLLPGEETPRREFIPLDSNWLKIAAAIVLVLVASSILYLTLSKANEILIETSANSIHKILPDGSEVWLNEKSCLTYQEDFADDRTVHLVGEAFFVVKKNPSKPFVIQTGSARVKVLGTSFNVKAYPDEMQTEVMVVTGQVSFGHVNSEKVVMLTPGTNGILTNKNERLNVDTQTDPNSLAWKDKELVFRKSPLASVLKTLHIYFRKDILVKNDSLLGCRFTGSFKDPTLQEVFETIGLALDIEITQQQDSYLLSGAGCKSD